MKKRYLVSGCLLGENCKYNGESNYNEYLDSFRQLDIFVGVCPEILGGLLTPRDPSEIENDRVYDINGNDVTDYFVNGASRTLEIANHYNIHKAILKSNSPSCGISKIYDGSFSNTLIDGLGVTARLLKDNLFKLYDENTLPIYDAIVVCAGKGERTNLPHNKIFEYSQNKSMYEASIEPFLTDLLCNKVIVVANKDEIDLFRIIIDNKRIEFVSGGESREESVFNGLKKSTSKYVLIHDGDRPYISDELKDNVLDNLLKNSINAVPFLTSGSKYDYQVNGRFIQTPQGYNKEILLDMMSKSNLKEYRDESSLISNKYEINYINGDINNIKITDYEDIKKRREYIDEDNI